MRRLKALTLGALVLSMATVAPGCGDEDEVRRLKGEYEQSFEVTSFVEEGDGCPGYGIGYWIEGTADFSEKLLANTIEERQPGFMTGRHAYVELTGRVYEDGHFGHGLQYSKQIVLLEVHSVQQSTQCHW